MKYKCLVFDHDDTVVQSMKTLSYPFFLYGLNIFRPGQTMTFHDYVEDCHHYGFSELCRIRFGFTEEELQREHTMWMDYVLSHTPDPYPGIDRILRRPYPLQDIMERYGLSPEQLLVVDDMKLGCKMASPVGVKVAYAGWNGLGVASIDEEMTALCDYSFSSVEELEKFLFD